MTGEQHTTARYVEQYSTVQYNIPEQSELITTVRHTLLAV